ncbi:MAG: DUF1957 domain-containing protein [Alphaproteobacteria bacterium]|nr:DUF1957 domain-containing protein [Alphaproteobacteria bacterium]
MNARLCLVLHAHLPFVRHPEYPDFLEEDWLYEAITETYLPLLEVYEGLIADGVDFRVAMTLSPPLVEMLADDLLQARYVERLERLVQLSGEELARCEARGEAEKAGLCAWYEALFQRRLDQFEGYGRDLVAAFRRVQDLGFLEVLTCGATHGFLPFMQHQPEAVRAQLQVAVAAHTRHFGRAPAGIWLPECAYYPGLDKELRAAGLRFFIGERHAVEHATPRPEAGVHAPILTPHGVAVFPRDPEVSQQVWSAESGYPGHPAYREFYRDLGYDAPFEHVAAYVQPTGLRKNTGLKLHRITGPTAHKKLYDPRVAALTARSHAKDFVRDRARQAAWLRQQLGEEAVLVAPYDAELFGHWWYEGPLFLDGVFRELAAGDTGVVLNTPSEVLDARGRFQVARPHFSTWGAKGYAEVWLDPSNEWIYPHLTELADRMVELARRFPSATGLTRRALDQAARELLLAQSSDWAFIMKTGTSVDYAVNRTRDHVTRFNALYEMLLAGEIDEAVLEGIEARDNLFPDLDYRVYGPNGAAA